MPPNTVTNHLTSGSSNFQDNQISPSVMNMKKKKEWYEFETELKWANLVFMMGIHLISLYYFITFPYFQHKFLVIWGKYFNHKLTNKIELKRVKICFNI